MSLQQQLDDFMAGVREKVPTNILSSVDAAYGELAADGRFPQALGVGDTLPAFTLNDAQGQPQSSQTLLARGPLVVSFYRGAWCPFCNIELRALQQVLPEIHALGAELVAISPELPDYSLPLIEREQLSFPVLSDLGNEVAAQCGIAFELEGELRRISLEVFGVDLPSFNGDASWRLPVPATFVVGRDGRVVLAFVDGEMRHRAEPTAILAALRELAAAQAA